MKFDLGFNENDFSAGDFGFYDSSFSFEPAAGADFGMPPQPPPVQKQQQSFGFQPLQGHSVTMRSPVHQINNNHNNSNNNRRIVGQNTDPMRGNTNNNNNNQQQQHQTAPSQFNIPGLMGGIDGPNAQDVINAPIHDVQGKIERAEAELNDLRQMICGELHKRALILEQLGKVYFQAM